MRILVVADEESMFLWDYYRDGKLAGLDLILSCGDLEPSYLSFWQPLRLVLFCMCMAITMTVTSRILQRVAFA